MWLGCQLPTVQGRHSRVTVGGHGIQSAIPELSEEQSTQVTLARHSGVEVRPLYQGVGGVVPQPFQDLCRLPSGPPCSLSRVLAVPALVLLRASNLSSIGKRTWRCGGDGYMRPPPEPGLVAVYRSFINLVAPEPERWYPRRV